MGEVRIVSAVVDAKVKGETSLPQPRALVVVKWIGYVWIGVSLLRLIWIVGSAIASAATFSELDLGAIFFETTFLMIAQSLFLMPFLGMCFCMKKSRYLFAILGPIAAIITCACTTIPTFIAMLGFVPPVAVWFCPSIRKWYDSIA